MGMMKKGIPQGTVHGPIFFQFFINDLLHLEISGKNNFFADDTVGIFDGLTTILDALNQNLLTTKIGQPICIIEKCTAA